MTSFSDLITFTRSSSAWRYNSYGLLEQIASDVPRFDFDPVNLALRGLLIEEQRTNLLTRSDAFGNSEWNPPGSNATVTANTHVAPDGTLTADTISNPDGASAYRRKNAPSITSSTNTYCGSIYVRKDSSATHSFRLNIGVETGGTGVATQVDMSVSTGVATRTHGNGQFGVVDAGNYWRLWALVTDNNTGNTSFGFNVWVSTGVGSGLSTTIWGAQLEVGSFPTSYIPTTSAQVTRAADVASVNTLSPWFRPDEGTVFSEFQSVASSGFPTVYSLNPDFFLYTNPGTSQTSLNGRGSAGYLSISGAAPLAILRRADAYAGSSQSSCQNGGSVVTSSLSQINSVTDMYLGRRQGTPSYINGYLRRIKFFPKKLTNSELQALTA